MLTPCFQVTQDHDFVIISLRVPFVKASEAEFFINGNSFKFYCKPYFLRLCLPGELVEDGRERAVHDISKGTITVYVPKSSAGQHFENLGMITSLLSKKPTAKVSSKPLIEIVGGDSGEVMAEGGDDCEKEEEFDWQVDQPLPVEEDEELQLDQCSFYGFADHHKGVFSKLQHEIPALVDCPDPDHMRWQERRVARLAHEEASFDPEHYLADLMESDEVIKCLCQFQPVWSHQLVSWKAKPLKEPDSDIIPFSDAEMMQLKELPNKEYLLDKAAERALYLGLVDIIFAYAYDYRTTEGEHNVESAWTICKLSSTLSWLEVFRGSVGEVLWCSVRRSLCYPLYRHWQLVQSVLQDTTHLFQLGRRKLLQCLLAVRGILNSSEPYYIMNDLYITDYCVWIQKASRKQIQKLSQELKKVCIERSSIGWELEELEQAAHLVAADDATEHNVGCESTCSSGGDSSRSDTRTANSENTPEATKNTLASKSKLKSEYKSDTGDNLRDAESEDWLKTGLKNDVISIHELTPKVAHDSINDCTGTAGVDTTPLTHESDGVGDLTDNFKCLLTLQPPHHPTQRLIEEL